MSIKSGCTPDLELFGSAGTTVSVCLYIFDFFCNALVTCQYLVMEFQEQTRVFALVFFLNGLPYIYRTIVACSRACSKIPAQVSPDDSDLDEDEHLIMPDEIYITPLIQFRRLVPELLTTLQVFFHIRPSQEFDCAEYSDLETCQTSRSWTACIQASQGLLIPLIVVAVVTVNLLYDLWVPRGLLGFCAVVLVIELSYVYGQSSKFHSSLRWGIWPGTVGVTGHAYIITVLTLRCATLAAVVVWFLENEVPTLITIYTAGVYLNNVIGPALRRLGEGWIVSPLDSCTLGEYSRVNAHPHVQL